MIEKRYCLTPEEWAYAKAELVLAEKLGLIENADIEALEKRCAEKNEENARLEMEKNVFYGPRRYSLPMYLQYELTRFRLDFVQPTENIVPGSLYTLSLLPVLQYHRIFRIFVLQFICSYDLAASK